ncbi:MAG TPA: long-chain fatty acid--CoA ligase [Prevotella sp.]|uniref:Long-chain fatty acid--CoA ligase n=1 Tax=Segatella copri TaxID=165179 RepID=A0A3R6LH72_9BACT|nr:AMP-binding protein [Segatella copri]HAW82752.1 long-chain fatty acid--CoA ligase [Prevotella sp.]MQM47499.1 long-chain fatty acid--CoA ligase [Segatella copri]MQM50026.1 long-chain fatty acid--CoA ligase [Segatella copri]MQM68913.1 long-chain fatty acid--CoA ligase [Segatella copri]MQM76229.1 long-chain fatty acid--CoA ligase [Segatella copri]
MNSIPSFNSYIENSIIKNWNLDALTDYKGATLQYHDIARKIEKLHILFENSDVKKGDKIAVCGRNSSQWAVAFLAIITYGAIVVPIQNEFKPEQIHNIVNHSESKLLFVGDVVATEITPKEMPSLEGIIYLPDNSLVISRSEKLTYARENLNAMFGHRYPKYFRPEHVKYHVDDPEELAMINYTSGTTGFSKGVMLPYRALWGNLDYLIDSVKPNIGKNSNILSTLPMAHMYGLMTEFLFNIVLGNHIFFLTRLPSPTLISEALSEIKPDILYAVPLVVDKIVRKEVFPHIQTNRARLLMNMPVINKRIKEKVREFVLRKFGERPYEVVVGGAPLNKEIENFFISVGFPIAMGYGTTETAPLITFAHQDNYVAGSCGVAVKHMEVKVLSDDPENVAGELVCRGINVMKGYYKNQEATDAVIDKDGWFHTGDLATMDADGHIFIRGRSKNMLLGPNGQNIYPEEIEDKLNSMAMVNESIVIQSDDKLVALVHPDMEEVNNLGFTDEDLENIMEQNRKELNMQIPSFAKVSRIKLHNQEFEKTAKKSIKRYLYQNAI